MKVAIYYNNHDIKLEDIPQPKIGEGELLIKVKASGICGTDVMEWYRIQKAPRILGHEVSGDIVQSKSDRFKVGERVFVSHHVPCNTCKYCLDDNHTACETLHQGNYDPGGYSEFIRIPKLNTEHGTYVLPENMSHEEGTMIEPLACAVRAQRIIGVKQGQTVLVLGSGLSGLLNIVIAKLKGARVLATDIDEYRLKKAKEFGANEVYTADKLPQIKADSVLLCTGALSAAQSAFNFIDKKGTLLLFAIPNKNIELPSVDVWRNEITITASYGAAPRDLEESIELIKDGKVDVKRFITHRLPFEQIQKGFDLVSSAKQSLKVVLLPTG